MQKRWTESAHTLRALRKSSSSTQHCQLSLFPRGIAAGWCAPQVLLDAPLADRCDCPAAPLQGGLSREPDPPAGHLRAGPDALAAPAGAALPGDGAERVLRRRWCARRRRDGRHAGEGPGSGVRGRAAGTTARVGRSTWWSDSTNGGATTCTTAPPTFGWVTARREILHVHRKNFLPTYGLFDEERFVERGHTQRAFDTPWGGRASILICEDAWHSITGTVAALDDAQVIFMCAAAPARGLQSRRRCSGPRQRCALGAAHSRHRRRTRRVRVARRTWRGAKAARCSPVVHAWLVHAATFACARRRSTRRS